MPNERSTALAIPDDIRKDLLESQSRQIESTIKLPQIKVMAAGVGMFEFTDDEQRQSEFSGIILGSHPRNVLWDRAFGSNVQVPDDEKAPACSSQDGKIGIPREGFYHKSLNREATTEDRIECASCPYNQWGSGNLVMPNKNPKGKAVTNQRSVYVALAGKNLPYELVLSATSIPEFDAYLARLLNLGRPMQAVLTRFTQTIKRNGGLAWGVVKFERTDDLEQNTFDWAIATMKRFEHTIYPSTRVAAVAPVEEVTATVIDEEQNELDAQDDDLPF